jgi:iron complex outermembrane receptor protein
MSCRGLQEQGGILMHTKVFWICWIVTIFLSQTVLAQEGDLECMEALGENDLAALYGDEEFVSIATGSSKPAYKAPAVASVIMAADIETMGARNLNEVLETVPGLHVGLSTLSRLDSVYSIRGIHTGFNPQVLMLMNGIPFPELWSGARPILFRLPVSSIARIEVIRGPGSAVYGADAYAGVINIITKEASDIDGTTFGGRKGSFDTHDLWFQHGKTLGDWDVALTFEWQKSNGDDDRLINSDFQSTLDSSFGTNALLAPGPLETRYEVFDTHLEIKRVSALGDWGLRLWNWRLNDAGVGAGAYQALDPEGRQSDDLYMVDLSYDTADLLSDWKLGARTSYQYLENDIHFKLLPDGTVVPIGSDGNINFSSPAGIVSFPDGIIANPDGSEKVTGLDLTAFHTGIESHRIRLGVGWKYQKMEPEESKNYGPGVLDQGPLPASVSGAVTDVTDTPNVYSPNESRELWYLSLQDEWQFARDWELTAGVRYDEYSDFGQTVNPRLALVWETRHNLTSKILYGSAFRAPSFSELYAINNPVALGNRDLDPETIDTLELSFDYRPTFEFQTVLSLFAYEAKDLIEFVTDPATGASTAQNARDQKGRGFELEANWKATRNLHLKTNYAFQHSEDQKTNKKIPDAPGQQLYFNAEWEFLPDMSLIAQFNWVGDRKRAASDSRSEIDDYTLVDLTWRWKNIVKNLDLAFALRNVFDEDAREPSSGQIPDDYPLEGRNAWVELKWSL